MYSLYINNKSGTLIYQKDFSTSVNHSANDKIRLASTFHGLCAISQQIAPLPAPKPGSFSFLQPDGISFVEADTFKLQCFETLTGMRFFVVAQPGIQDLAPFLKQIYEAYSDWVLKNPFYEQDQPVRVESFDKQVMRIWEAWRPVVGAV
uniref:Trafficking protein particle complex subunit n=1 Tax=Chromera velia CCMP2878 TaxID=1169474 RepID=A0A0G4FG78_9ALVE|mmetsp:Transcript_37571/g.73887  ORF Transcript_37571/g.73887 Transcript_37571/m.73887 type:complete len:149 (+) Transcript_37571:402-848(+)|eukprot:Cvel_16804.t1-p1 / transcript=Cvel_16804.t1 / gene=Cvel_16804 / organism=Chromera_velia_CCMP2878 / gene_product=Trafficking protein particle complex subunit 4, putative / transcript_product=Trafficking protein particle complex subunit 4, putative / location=Cvel_scaffold1312:28170-30626(-) / protein_length=148 / sequence_SO=supercontig / SO=protein_coding / is_pseudo=false